LRDRQAEPRAVNAISTGTAIEPIERVLYIALAHAGSAIRDRYRRDS
jgi:hypothetical protein